MQEAIAFFIFSSFCFIDGSPDKPVTCRGFLFLFFAETAGKEAEGVCGGREVPCAIIDVRPSVKEGRCRWAEKVCPPAGSPDKPVTCRGFLFLFFKGKYKFT